MIVAEHCYDYYRHDVTLCFSVQVVTMQRGLEMMIVQFAPPTTSARIQQVVQLRVMRVM